MMEAASASETSENFYTAQRPRIVIFILAAVKT
jgi:hypothetical protein